MRYLARVHLAVGLIGFVIFLASGAYMRLNGPALYASNAAVRFSLRANHVDILLASLVNAAVGIYLLPADRIWRRILQTVGSCLLLASPCLYVAAFLIEGPLASPERRLTLWGTIGSLAGVLFHAAGNLGRPANSTLTERERAHQVSA